MKIIPWINKIISKLLIILMAAIVLDVIWQVLTRFILKNPSSYSEELAGFLLIWIGLLGASHALYTRSHLGIDILTYKLTGIRKRIIDITVYSLVILFAFFVLVIGGYKLVMLTFTLKQISPALKLPMGFVYLVLPISGILMIIYSAAVITAAISGKQDKATDHQISALD